MMPPKFFITYSHRDNAFAQRLFQDLCANRLEGFFDEYSIQPGESIATRIAKGLEECDIYVPVLSPAALESPWCEYEIDLAINLRNERGRNGRPRIIPVVAENCAVPVVLRGFLRIDFAGRYDDALKELLTKGFSISLVPPRLPVATLIPPPVLTLPLPKVITPPRTIINPKDGKEMILIPAGEFVMGSKEIYNAQPPHNVYLDAFYIARYPVTNANYKRFVDAAKHSAPSHWSNGQISPIEENDPVVNVSWKDAIAYCKWAGGRLPTEAEWEKAASWDDMKKEKCRYPWGNKFGKNKCNSLESGIGGTTPVGTYSAKGGDSVYGIADMAGNVWEWCNSLYKKYPYHADDGRENMQGSGSRVLRGGSWYNLRDDAHCTFRRRLDPVLRHVSVGFRIAESVAP